MSGDINEIEKKFSWLYGHISDINYVFTSKNEEILATASIDGKVCLWDIQTSKQLFSITKKFNTIAQIGITSNNQHLILSWTKGEIEFFDLGSKIIQSSFKGPQRPNFFVISSDNQYCVFNQAKSEQTILYNFNTKTIIELSEKIILFPIMTLSKTFIGILDENTITVWDFPNPKPILSIKTSFYSISYAIICEKPNIVALVPKTKIKNYNEVYIYSLSTGAFIRKSNKHSEIITCIEYFLEPDLLMTGAKDGIICICHNENENDNSWLIGHNSPILSLKLVSSLEFISISADLTIIVWDFITKRQTSSFMDCRLLLQINMPVLENSKKILLTFSNKNAYLYDFKFENKKCITEGHNELIPSLATFKNYIVTTCNEQYIRVWDSILRSCIGKISVDCKFKINFAYFLDDYCFFTDSPSFKVVLWNLKTGKKQKVFTGNKSIVKNIALYKQENKYLISAAGDFKYFVWKYLANID